jgi:hypothetical protein
LDLCEKPTSLVEKLQFNFSKWPVPVRGFERRRDERVIFPTLEWSEFLAWIISVHKIKLLEAQQREVFSALIVHKNILTK